MNQEKKNKLQELLKRIKTLETSIPTGEIKSLTDQIIGEHAQTVSNSLKNDSVLKYLDGLNEKVGQFKKDFNLGPVVNELNNLIEDVSKIREEISVNLQSVAQENEEKLDKIRQEIADSLLKTSTESQKFTQTNLEPVLSAIEKLNLEISNVNKDSKGKSVSLKESIGSIESQLTKIGEKIKSESQKGASELSTARDNFEKSLKESIGSLRTELMSRIGNLTTRGGNMNRNIAVGGNTSVLSRYTDINIKAGSNVTLTYTNNNTTKYLDLTIASSGGGGSVGGTVRSINNISTSDTAGSTSGTDYVYIASAGIALTLPTASGNTNLYTVKNTSSSSVLVVPDGVDTIDAQTNLILRTQYTAVDLISDGTSNWNIT